MKFGVPAVKSVKELPPLSDRMILYNVPKPVVPKLLAEAITYKIREFDGETAIAILPTPGPTFVSRVQVLPPSIDL